MKSVTKCHCECLLSDLELNKRTDDNCIFVENNSQKCQQSKGSVSNTIVRNKNSYFENVNNEGPFVSEAMEELSTSKNKNNSNNINTSSTINNLNTSSTINNLKATTRTAAIKATTTTTKTMVLRHKPLQQPGLALLNFRRIKQVILSENTINSLKRNSKILDSSSRETE